MLSGGELHRFYELESIVWAPRLLRFTGICANWPFRAIHPAKYSPRRATI